MGWSILEKALQRTASVANEQLVLIRLCVHADVEKNGDCWPKIEHICEKTGLGRSTVQRALRRLLERGEISISKRQVKHLPPTYRVDVGMPDWQDKAGQNDLSETAQAGQNDLPQSAEAGQNDLSRQVKMTWEGGQNDLPIRNPNRNPNKKPKPTRAQARARAEWLKGELEKVARMDLSLKATGWSAAEAIAEVPWITEIGASFGMINGTVLDQFEGFLEAAESKPSFGRKKRLKQTWRNSCRLWRDKLGAPQHEEPAPAPRADGALIVTPSAQGVVMWGKKPTKLSAYVAGMVRLMEADEPDLALVIDVSRCPKLAEPIRDWAPTVERAAITVVDGTAAAPQIASPPDEQPGMF